MSARLHDGQREDLTVTMESRSGKKVRVGDQRDKRFLELADRFILDAREAQTKSKRRRSRRS